MNLAADNLSCEGASLLIRENRHRIISHWLTRCLTTVSAAQQNNTISVRNSIPEFLDQLSDYLVAQNEHEPDSVSRVHGRERASIGHYTLDQVIYEYQILREVISDFLNLEFTVSKNAQERIHRFIDIGLRIASTTFSEIVSWGVEAERARQLIDRESDHRITKAFELSKLGYYEWDIPRDIFIFSEKFKSDWDLESNVSLEKAVQRIHPTDREDAIKKILGAVHTQTICSNQYRLLLPDGKIRWIEAQGQATYSASGEPLKFFGTSLDISARKQAELMAEQARNELREFFVQAPVPLIILEGPEYFVSLANTLYEKLVGRSVTGKTLSEAFPHGEAKYYLPILDSVYKTGVPYFGRELPLELLDDQGTTSSLKIDIAYQPYRDSQGRIKGVMALVYDVTDKVESRKQLLESAAELAIQKQKLEVLVNESSAAIGLMRGPDLIFEIANTKWQALVSKREYLGRAYKEVYPELVGSPAFQSLKDTFNSGIPFVTHAMKLVVTSPSGLLEDQYFSFTNIRIADSNGNPYGVYCHALNVTEEVLSRKKFEESASILSGANNELREERELRERFVATLTHDLRTPMTAAKMSAELLVRKSGDAQLVKNSAERIVSSVNRADRMIQDLLDANRLKAGEGIPLSLEECCLDELLLSTVAGLQELHGPRFQLSTHSEKIIGNWDSTYLRRVIENLATNAVKYGDTQTRVSISSALEAGWVKISVHNWGEIISTVDLQTLFEPYRRTSSAKSSGKKGWGIGLTLVKGIAEAHGGSVSVTSDTHSGTTFVLKLPLGNPQRLS